jgi:hypothetical protein
MQPNRRSIVDRRFGMQALSVRNGASKAPVKDGVSIVTPCDRNQPCFGRGYREHFERLRH